jgi:subtilisin family serine protease
VTVLAAAAIVTALVGLPHGTTAPPPGSIPLGAQVQVLDRQLGIVAVDLRRRDATRALVRLRRAPGVRYATISAPAGGLGSAEAAAGCTFTTPKGLGTHPTAWRTTIRLSTHSAAGFTVGIPDTGADLSRLGGPRGRIETHNFTGGSGVTDEVDHGTEIASLIGASRPDLGENGIIGVAPDVGLAIARVAHSGACDSATLARNLIVAFAWFRSIGDVQIVNVSMYLPPSPALIESLRALQESGTLVVAATGNVANPGKATFPAAEPHVLGVGALGSSPTKVWASSGRGPQVDLVAPAAGSGVVYSSYGSQEQAGITPDGTSFSTPLVSGAAALVWAKHSAWDASRVAAALMLSAKHLSGTRPNTTSGYGRLDVKAALSANPPPDLEEPNDWASAARGLAPLPHASTLSATVGGNNDPLDAYPITTTAKSSVRIAGNGTLQAYLVGDAALSSIEKPAAAIKAASVSRGAGRFIRLTVPRNGRWYVVVTAQAATSPVGYKLRVG